MNAVTPPRAQASLARLLRPRTLAVVGGHAAAVLVRQAEKIGFAGEIWPVHPRHKEVAGRRAFARVADLPAAPDAAFIGVNRVASIDVVAELAQAGCGGAVAYASGYAEAGEAGRALQDELVAASLGMPVFGPNCYGFINYLDRALVWPDQFGGKTVARGVAIITQSGNIGLNMTMQRRALPIGYLITLGNQASLGHAAAMQAVLDDPRVTAIGLHMEGLGDPRALAEAVARAHAQGVPVVALKTGRSAAGAAIALSHTASLASGDAVVAAFFARIGVARVESVPALLETLKLLHGQGALPGRRIASLSCSGGEAALIADCAGDAGVRFVELTAASRAEIAATVPAVVSVTNPMDYQTFAWRDRPAMAAIFGAMMRAGADMTLLILDFPRGDTCDPADWAVAAAALADAQDATGQPAGLLATLPEALPEDVAEGLAARGIVPLFGMGEALAAIAAAADCGEFAGGGEAPLLLGGDRLADAETAAEWEGKRRLARFGVVVPEGGRAASVDGAGEIARRIGYPVVVKASGAALAHKSEVGGVALNLCNDAAVGVAAARLLALTGEVLVERMVTGAVAELIVGVARDPVLGLYLVLGSGGVLAELVGDTATLMLPAGRDEVAAALDGLRVARLMAGFRGGVVGDRAAAIEAVMAIQAFAVAHDGVLAELDVNPLMVRGAGMGAVAADVLLRMVREVGHG